LASETQADMTRPGGPAAAQPTVADRRQRVCLGVITAAHGVRGEVRVKSFTTRPEDVGAYGPVEDGDGHPLAFTVTGKLRGGVKACLDGVNDRDRAAALAGTKLYVPRAALPDPSEDEFYHSDLVDLRVEEANGTMIGRVAAVHNFGASDILEIVWQRNGETALVPFSKKTVPVIDLTAGRLVVAPEADRPPEVDGPEGSAP